MGILPVQSYRLMSELQIAEDGRYLGGDIPFNNSGSGP